MKRKNSTILAEMENGAAGRRFLISTIFQIRYQVYVKLPDIETGNVLSVQVHYVSVGDAPFPLWLQQGEFCVLSGGVHRHQAVVSAVKVLYNGIGDIQRELAVLSLLAVGHDALVHHAGHV